MRNLKRALSLALASVMLLGMMVVGTSAASYPDVDANDNVEAIEVLKTVGAMKGDNYGKFNPDDVVTRNEMATVIARLLLGAEAETYVGVHPFTDVPSWADKYVAACYDVGIVKGTSATTYNGTATVTAQEAATMMLRVLGYEGIAGSGADWARPVVATANQIRLFKNVTGSATAPLTRNQVAQLSLNALEADMVELVNSPVFDGREWTLQNKYEALKDLNNNSNGGVGYNYTNDPAGVTTHQKEYLQLCEDLYDGKLVKDTRTADDFERPATTWKYDGKVIGSYMNTPELEYTKTVKLGDIYKDLSLGKALAAEDVEFYRNGRDESEATGGAQLTTKNTVGAELTSPALATMGLVKGDAHTIGGNGVLTQVYTSVNANGDVSATITMIETFVGTVNNVYKATSTTDRYITLSSTNSFYSPNAVWSRVNNRFETENFAADDLVTFTAAWNGSSYDLETVEPLEKTATAVLTKWEGGSVIDDETGKSNSNFTAGQTYKYSNNYMVVDENGTDRYLGGTGNGIATFKVNEDEVNIYLDKYNYAIYVSGVEGATNYAAVIGIGASNTHGSETKGVTLLLPDGTQKAVTAKMDDWSVMTVVDQATYATLGNPVANTAYKNLVTDGVADIVTYSVGSDGIYKLTLAGLSTANDGTTKMHTGKYSADAKNANTTFASGKSALTIHTKLATPANYGNAAQGTYYTTSKTIFMVATQKKTTDTLTPTQNGAYEGRNYNVYVGYENAPGILTAASNVNGMAFALNKEYGGQIDVVYIDAVKMAGISGADTYFVKDGSDIITTSDGKYYKLPAIVNDELTTILIDADTEADWSGNRQVNDIASGTNKNSSALNANSKETLEKAAKYVYAIENIIKDSKTGIITSCDVKLFNEYNAGTVRDRNDVLGVGAVGSESTYQSSISSLLNSATYWSCVSDVKVYYVNKDWELSATTLGEIQTDPDDLVFAMDNDDGSGAEKKLTHVFVKEVETPTSTGPAPSPTGWSTRIVNPAKVAVGSAALTTKPQLLALMPKDGAYMFKAEDTAKLKALMGTLSVGWGAGLNAQDAVLFKFTAPTDGNSNAAIIQIVDQNDEVVWNDSIASAGSDGAEHFFLAQLTKTTSSTFYNSGSQSMTGAALKAGTYSWTITAAGVELLKGTFTIK